MGSRPEEILERWESLETNCYIQTSQKPACSRTFYFQSSLEIVEHAYENKIHGGLLTAGARGWGWEKREIDVLSFSFLAHWLRSAGRRFTKNKRQRLPYRLIQTPKQTNKQTTDSVVGYFKEYNLLNDDPSISNSYLNKTADVFIFQEQVSRKTTPAFRQLNNPSNIN